MQQEIDTLRAEIKNLRDGELIYRPVAGSMTLIQRRHALIAVTNGILTKDRVSARSSFIILTRAASKNLDDAEDRARDLTTKARR